MGQTFSGIIDDYHKEIARLDMHSGEISSYTEYRKVKDKYEAIFKDLINKPKPENGYTETEIQELSKPLEELKCLNNSIDARYKRKEVELINSVYNKVARKIYEETRNLHNIYGQNGMVSMIAVEHILHDISDILYSEQNKQEEELRQFHRW